jgi:hypothetical protein
MAALPGADPADVALFDRSVALVAAELGGDLDEARRHKPWPSRASSPAWIRCADVLRIAMYLLRTIGDVHGAAVGRAAGVDRATITYACGDIEDGRDDPGFDALMQRLERRVKELIEGD